MADENVPQPSYEVPPTPADYPPPPAPTDYQAQPNPVGYAPQPQYYAQPQPVRQGWGSAKKDKWVAFFLAWFLGVFGIHKFYLGYKTEGMTMLLVSLIGSLCFGIGPMVMAVVAYIEAVRYVILTQEDFEATYVNGSKGWF
ncbi:MAG: TM2 domain-containing protein [Actinomycetia bacterium]|nr:TM2 domain-containing protein [Actinomycetes bacterium]